MKTLILYKPNTELESSVNEYVRNFEKQTSTSIDLVSADTAQGIEMAQLYDIVQFPAIVALRDDGSLVEVWAERDKWPTVSELSFYGHS